MMTQKPFAEIDSLCGPAGERWRFTLYGGRLEHEALSTCAGNSEDWLEQPCLDRSAMPLVQAQVLDLYRSSASADNL